MGVSKNNPILLSILNKVNKDIEHDEIVQLKNKWMTIQKKSNIKKVFFNKEEKEYLKNKKHLNMCVNPNWLPYEKIKNGKYIGISSEYVKLFKEQLTIPINLIETKTWMESLHKARDRQCDFIATMSETEYEKRYFSFTKEYISAPLAIATKTNRRTIADISNFLGKTFGVVKGYAYKEILMNKYPKIKIVDIESIKDGLEKVESNHLFAVIDTLPALGQEIQTNFNDLKIAGKIKGDWGFSIATRNDEVLLDGIFNKLLNAIPSETKNAILNKWIVVKYQESIDYTILFWILLIVMVMISVGIYKNREISKINQKMESYIHIVDENVLTTSTNLQGIITNASQAFCEISGYNKNELVGKSHNIVRHEDMTNEFFDEMWATILKDEIWKGELKNKTKDGDEYWIDMLISPRYDSDNHKIGYNAIRHDITDKKRVEFLSISDELTTLYNKRHFNEVLDNEIKRAKRDETRFGYLMFDVDFFKQYNDTYGHAKGDIVLSSIGKKLKELCKRSTDIAFRIGGEEFAVIFHPHTEGSAMQFAELIREEIEKLGIEHKHNKASEFITISTGLYYAVGMNIKSPEEIYPLTDEGLYKAKSLGRNQTIKV